MDHAHELKNLSVKSIAYPKTLRNYFIPQNNEVPITTYDLFQQRTSDEKPHIIKRGIANLRQGFGTPVACPIVNQPLDIISRLKK